MPISNVINAQAKFIVRFAKNLENKSAVERKLIMDDLPPKTQKLIRHAQAVFAKQRRETK